MNDSAQKHVAVVGGGISGLTAAWNLVKAGNKVDIYTDSNRLGGKIESAILPETDKVVNVGAEFIDSTQTGMRQLCKELGVNLIPATDQENIIFRLPNGTILTNEQFFAAAGPLQNKIIQDKVLIAANPNGERAKHITDLSLDEYLHELNGTPPKGDGSLSGTVKNLQIRAKNIFKRDKVSQEILATYAGSYASEAGRDPVKISALGFINESSPKSGELLESDAAFRVGGGTEKIIKALESKLRYSGAQFHLQTKATSIGKDNSGFNLTFEGNPDRMHFDQAVLALPAYALARIQGLDSVGLTGEDVNSLNNVQYTHNAKFTVKTNELPPGALKNQNAQLFSSDGFQAWQSSPGLMTFLVGGDKVDKLKTTELMNDCLDKYAAANGISADRLFDKTSWVFRGPDSKRPCYASPSPGQLQQLAKLSEKFSELAAEGIGIAGTYLPLTTPEGTSIGFMECGVQSATRATSRMAETVNQQDLSEVKLPKMEMTPEMQSFVARYRAEKNDKGTALG